MNVRGGYFGKYEPYNEEPGYLKKKALEAARNALFNAKQGLQRAVMDSLGDVDYSNPLPMLLDAKNPFTTIPPKPYGQRSFESRVVTRATNKLEEAKKVYDAIRKEVGPTKKNLRGSFEEDFRGTEYDAPPDTSVAADATTG